LITSTLAKAGELEATLVAVIVTETVALDAWAQPGKALPLSNLYS